jgi:hypothetical protein
VEAEAEAEVEVEAESKAESVKQSRKWIAESGKQKAES